MKKILILIMVLVLGVVACSSPTSIKNNGGSSDSNGNSGNQPPVEVPGEKPDVLETPQPEPQPPVEKPDVPETPQPEPQPPTLEQKYKGLALRLAKAGREDLIGKTFIGNTTIVYGEVTIYADGKIVIVEGHRSVKIETYTSHYKQKFETQGEKRNGGWYDDSFETFNDGVSLVRVVGTEYSIIGTDSVANCRKMYELEFANNYNEIRLRRSAKNSSYFETSDDSAIENIDQAILTVKN